VDELLDERGREFAYEMFRREDLIRFGRFQDAWWVKEQDPDKHYELSRYHLPLLQPIRHYSKTKDIDTGFSISCRHYTANYG